MITTVMLGMRNGDVPEARKANDSDMIILTLDGRSKNGGDIFMPPAQAEAIVNALVEALAALKVPK